MERDSASLVFEKCREGSCFWATRRTSLADRKHQPYSFIHSFIHSFLSQPISFPIFLFLLFANLILDSLLAEEPGMASPAKRGVKPAFYSSRDALSGLRGSFFVGSARCDGATVRRAQQVAKGGWEGESMSQNNLEREVMEAQRNDSAL